VSGAIKPLGWYGGAGSADAGGGLVVALSVQFVLPSLAALVLVPLVYQQCGTENFYLL